MRDTLHISDPDYLEELFPWFSKLLMERLNKRADNVKSKYRADMTQLRKACSSSEIQPILVKTNIAFFLLPQCWRTRT